MDPRHLIETFGTIGLLVIIFAESGLLLGLVFPGDSLLFTAGLLASQNRFGLNIAAIAGGCFLAAMLGAQAGYWLGRRFGPALFRRPDSRIFKQRYVEHSRDFFERHGSKAVFIGRFVPFARTLVPMLAGIGEMPRRAFFTFNVAGALVWAVGISLAGYFLGSTIPSVDRYLLPIVALIVVVSVIPPIVEIVRQRRRRAASLPTASEADAEAAELREVLRGDQP